MGFENTTSNTQPSDQILEAQKQQLREEITKIGQDIERGQQLLATLTTTEAEVAEMKDIKATLEKEVASLRDEMAPLPNIIANHKSDIAQLVVDKQESSDVLVQLRDEESVLVKSINGLERKEKELTESVDKLSGLIEAMSEDEAMASTAAKKAEAYAEDAKGKLQEYNEKLSAIQDEIEKAKVTRAAVEAEIPPLEAIVAAKRKEAAAVVVDSDAIIAEAKAKAEQIELQANMYFKQKSDLITELEGKAALRERDIGIAYAKMSAEKAQIELSKLPTSS